MVTAQVPVPVQPPPLQPVNVEPAAGVAVRGAAGPPPEPAGDAGAPGGAGGGSGGRGGGVAVRVMRFPFENRAARVAPREIRAGALAMLPFPVPDLATVSVKDDCANVGVTGGVALIVTVHEPVPVQPLPLQPVK